MTSLGISKFPPIPPLFAQKKTTILSALATPEDIYTDLSPKGSVDARIKNLINRINSLEGIVTTSSCAGRISVFLEGTKAKAKADDGNGRQAAVPGGKGMGGRWLFVAHDPVDVTKRKGLHDMPVTTLFGLEHEKLEAEIGPGPEARFVKFQFEPMILHIMCASLLHAQPALSAAINAGFRESGIQSLKNLEDLNAFPMVAIRTAGLALGSIIGYAQDADPGEEKVVSLVGEEYLEILLRLANARFSANEERIQRFIDELLGGKRVREPNWEDSQSRSERKKAEGLKKKELLKVKSDPLSKEEECADFEEKLLLLKANADFLP